MFVSHYVKPVLVLISRKKKIFNISNELRSGFLLKRLCISTYFSEEKNFQKTIQTWSSPLSLRPTKLDDAYGGSSEQARWFLIHLSDK